MFRRLAFRWNSSLKAKRCAAIGVVLFFLAACQPAETRPPEVLTAVTAAPISTATGFSSGAPVITTEAPPATPTLTKPLASPAIAAHTPSASELRLAPEAPPALPPRLIIPKLKMDKELVTVPIVNGSWDLDKLGDRVGRLESTGRMPHDTLAMVLAGHVTTSAVDYGPFGELWKLQPRDTVTYRWGNTDFEYTIQKKLSALPWATGLLYVEDGQRLMLVTCGEWDYVNLTWTRRLIVVAELTGELPAP